MLEARLIFPVDEVVWASPIFIIIKKESEDIEEISQ